MRRIITAIFLVLVVYLSILMAGCDKEQSVKVDDTGATAESVSSVVNANNQFAFDLYSKYRTNEGNIFFSPYSISTAMAMAYEGAKGETADEIKNVFHFPDSGIMRPAYARIYNEINKKDKSYKLNTANALWAQKDYPFLENYFKLIEKYYGGKVSNLDFIFETEKSRVIINNWVEKQTNDKIKNLIPKGILNSMTRLVLTNAIYFKGSWLKQFDEKNTYEDDFNLSSGSTVKVQMMSITGDEARFNYAESDKFQALELPYDGEELSMIILLPKENAMNYNLDYIERTLNAENFAELRKSFREGNVDVYIPKFKIETKYSMNEDLKEMGMPTAFTMDADFSGMTGRTDLYISDVIHQAFIEVNEEGTEAAAATAVVMELKAIMPKYVFKANHPFVFIVQQRKTGNILFMGRVSNPTM